MLLNVVYIGNRACCAQSGCTLNMKKQCVFQNLIIYLVKTLKMKRTSTATVQVFFFFFLLILNFEESSKFWAAKYKNVFNLFILRQVACIESFLPVGWRTFIWWKFAKSAALFWFGLRDVKILQIFYSRAVIQRTVVDFPTFLESGLAEKIAVSTTRLSMK
jgi:hypothetical protein